MKAKVLFSNCFVLLLIISYNCYGQNRFFPGYVITTTNDTIRGEVLIKDSYNVIVKQQPNGLEKKYSSNEIHNITTNDKAFVVEELKGQKTFLREISVGYLSLYSSKDGEYFYFNRNDTATLIKEDKFYGFLKWYLSDCSEIANATNASFQKNYAYRLNDMVELVTKYNKCVKPNEQPVVNIKQRKVVTQLGFKFGIGTNYFKYTKSDAANPDFKFDKGLTLSAGLFLNASIGKHFSLQPELLYSYLKGSSSRVPEPINDNTYTVVDMHFNYLRLPILVRYELKKGKVTPFFIIGPQVGASLTSRITREPNGFVFKNEADKNVKFNTLEGGYIVGIGASIPSLFRKGLTLEARATRSRYMYKGSIRSLIGTDYTFMVGINL